MEIQFSKVFGDCVTVDGGSSIVASLHGGVSIRATIEPDCDTRPTDFDCFDDCDVETWRRGEWQYCGIVLSVYIDGQCIDPHAASLWGIEANFRDDNSYLNTVAAELAAELDIPAILDDNARRATAAPVAVTA